MNATPNIMDALGKSMLKYFDSSNGNYNASTMPSKSSYGYNSNNIGGISPTMKNLTTNGINGGKTNLYQNPQSVSKNGSKI